MELNITKLCSPETPFRDYSSSVARMGADAGKLTWSYAMEDAPDYTLIPESECDTVRDYFRTFGAWSADELARMGYAELQALLLQYISGSVQDVPSDAEPFTEQWWEDYEQACENGTACGEFCCNDDGQVYFIT